jgi:hypothetical protein
MSLHSFKIPKFGPKKVWCAEITGFNTSIHGRMIFRRNYLRPNTLIDRKNAKELIFQIRTDVPHQYQSSFGKIFYFLIQWDGTHRQLSTEQVEKWLKDKLEGKIKVQNLSKIYFIFKKDRTVTCV